MKMVMIAYNEAVDAEVMEMLALCRVENYTKTTGVFGKGSTSGTHLGTDVWPGRNNVVHVAVADEQAAVILAQVKELRKNLGGEGIKAFSWNLDGLT